MTVTDVRCRRLTAALHSPFVTALRATSTVETLVVELVDSDGLHGFGESPQVWRVTGESLAGAEACLLGPLRDVVIGRSVDDLADLLLEAASAVVANHGAKAALDVALHDLAARRRGSRCLATSAPADTASTPTSLSPPGMQTVSPRMPPLEPRRDSLPSS